MLYKAGAFALVNMKRYEKLQEPPKQVCTHRWFMAIVVLLGIQSAVLVGMVIGGIVTYDNNKESIDAWMNLPWTSIAASVDNGYKTLQQTPIHETLTNAYVSTERVKQLINYHEGTTLKSFKQFSDEMAANKYLFQNVAQASADVLPVIQQLKKALGDEPIADVHSLVAQSKHLVTLLTDDEIKSTYFAAMALIKDMDMLIRTHQAKEFMESVSKASNAFATSFTNSNINRTIHAIEDFEHSVHKAEARMERVGEILAKP